MLYNRFLKKIVTLAGVMSLVLFFAACPQKEESGSQEMNMEQTEGMDQSGSMDSMEEGTDKAMESETAPATGGEEQ